MVTTTNPATCWDVAFCPSPARASPNLQPTELGSGGLLPQLPPGLQCQRCHRCSSPCLRERGRTSAPAWPDEHRGKWRRLRPR